MHVVSVTQSIYNGRLRNKYQAEKQAEQAQLEHDRRQGTLWGMPLGATYFQVGSALARVERLGPIGSARELTANIGTA